MSGGECKRKISGCVLNAQHHATPPNRTARKITLPVPTASAFAGLRRDRPDLRVRIRTAAGPVKLRDLCALGVRRSFPAIRGPAEASYFPKVDLCLYRRITIYV